MTSKTQQDVEVRQSLIDGRGIFAKRRFKKGEVVLRWDITRTISKDALGSISVDEQKYVHPLDEDTLILIQIPERYVNHSCDNNTVARDFSDIAIRDIEVNEEITSDYSIDGSGSKFQCHCGSPQCRGTIG